MSREFDISQFSPQTGDTLRGDSTVLNLADLASNLQTGFNELRTAEYTPIVERKSTFGLSSRRDVQTTTGSASISTSGGEIQLSTGTSTSSKATLDSARSGTYLSGIQAIAGAGWRVGALPTGEQVARVGYFDDSNGFGVGLDATSLFHFLRDSGTETVVRRSGWSDPLDGTGPSGHDVSPTDLHIWRMPFRWYGGGPVRLFADVVADSLYPSMAAANAINRQGSSAIFEAVNLPIRCEVENGSTASNLDLFIGGRQFGVFGRRMGPRRINSEDRTGVTVSTTGLTPLISIRFKSGFAFREVVPVGIDINTNNDVVAKTLYNGTLTGASFASPSDTTSSESAIEVDTDATAYSAGDKNWSGFAVGGAGNQAIATPADLPETPIPEDAQLVLAAQAKSSEATVDAVLRWTEEW